MLVLLSHAGMRLFSQQKHVTKPCIYQICSLKQEAKECAKVLIDFSLRQYQRSYKTEYLIH